MKFSVAIAGENAPKNAFVVWRGYKGSIAKASAYGYDGVELALSEASDINKADLQHYLSKNHMSVSCISTGLTFAQKGYYLSSRDEATHNGAMKAVTGLIHLASEFGNLVTLGRVRGFVEENQSRMEAEEALAESLRTLERIALDNGVKIAIEPINRYESNFLNSVDEAAEYLDRYGLTNIGILADLFHMNIEDSSICGAIERNFSRIYHVHIADSNRHAPGMGHTDIKGVINTLKRLNYRGWLSVEILSGNDADQMAYRASSYLREILNH